MNRLPRWASSLLIIGLIGLMGAGFVFFFVTKMPDSFITQKIIRPVVGFVSGMKKFENVDAAKPEFSLEASGLYEDFMNDPAGAKNRYENKIVQVSGTVSGIAGQTDANRVILLEVDGVSNISCQMDPQFNDRLTSISAGDALIIKGICSGAKTDDLLGSLDVLMNRCVIVQ